MALNQPFIGELQHEAANTRKMLERVPTDKLSWKPHGNSMTLQRLASHLAEIPIWATFTIDMDELDLGTGNVVPFAAKSSEELLEKFDENMGKAMASLEAASDETLMEMWTLRNGEHVIMSMPKVQVLRAMIFNHNYHHRGQLSVYLRLIGVPVPGMYGPSFDEKQEM